MFLLFVLNIVMGLIRCLWICLINWLCLVKIDILNFFDMFLWMIMILLDVVNVIDFGWFIFLFLVYLFFMDLRYFFLELNKWICLLFLFVMVMFLDFLFIVMFNGWLNFVYFVLYDFNEWRDLYWCGVIGIF